MRSQKKNLLTRAGKKRFGGRCGGIPAPIRRILYQIRGLKFSTYVYYTKFSVVSPHRKGRFSESNGRKIYISAGAKREKTVGLVEFRKSYG